MRILSDKRKEGRLWHLDYTAASNRNNGRSTAVVQKEGHLANEHIVWSKNVNKLLLYVNGKAPANNKEKVVGHLVLAADNFLVLVFNRIKWLHYARNSVNGIHLVGNCKRNLIAPLVVGKLLNALLAKRNTAPVGVKIVLFVHYGTPVKAFPLILYAESRNSLSNCVGNMDFAVTIAGVNAPLGNKLQHIASLHQPVGLFLVGNVKVPVLQGIGKHFHKSYVECIAVVIRNAVGVIKIANKKVRVKADVHGVVVAKKKPGLLTANNVLHTAGVEKLLVLVQNAKDSAKMTLKVIQLLNRKHVVVLKLLQLLNLLRVARNRNNTTIVQPSVRVNRLQNLGTVNVLGSIIQNLDFGHFVIYVANGTFSRTKNLGIKESRIQLARLLYGINNPLVRRKSNYLLHI